MKLIKKAIQLTTLFLVLLITSLILPNHTSAQAILFEDDFSNGLEKWDHYRGEVSEWHITSEGMLGTTISTSGTVREIIPKDSWWNTNWGNYIIEYDYVAKSGTDKNFTFRVQSDDHWYEFHGVFGSIILEKVHRPEMGGILTSASYSIQNNKRYHVKITVIDDYIQLCLTPQNSEERCVIEYNDVNNTITFGKISLRVATGTAYPTEVYFDNVVVTNLDPETTLSVPDLKQYDLRWKDEEYDQASEWAPGTDTIERWGCGLTSAAMVLRYHNHDVWPDSLNDWLNGESDGYVRNGLLNWLAVSRYTYTTEDSPTLEFRRYSADDNKVEDELNAERPPILGLSGHFVVVKGEQGSDFLINDPDSTIDSLSQVETAREAEYSSIYSYSPSNTDLSYIMLVVDSGITLKVYNSDNQLVGDFYPDEFLKDDVGGGENEHLNIFLLPTPGDGVYRVEATGPAGSYQLDSYLYNEQGEVQTFSSERTIAGEDQKDEFLITIDGVIDTPDATSPVVGITSPVDNTILKGLVDIVGSVSDDVKLSHYNLSLYPGTTDLSDGNTHSGERLNDSNWCTIPISGTVSLTDDFSGNLCTDWNTTQYVDGEYQIRLAARDAAGNRDTSDPDTGGTSSVHIIGITIDNTAPVVEITSHDDGDLVSGVVEVRGSVSDNNPHHYYAVLRNSSNSDVAGAGVVNRYDSFTDEVLFTFDSTILNEGETYTIWLAARDAAGNRDDNAGSLDIVKIVINNTPDIQISISSIINDLEILQGEINSRLYRLLHTQLKVANKLFDRGLTRPTKALLRAVYRKVKAFTSLFTDPEASQILQDNLLILLGTL